MQFNHQNSTLPDVYRTSSSKLPNLYDFQSYLLIGQKISREFEVYFSDDGEDLAGTLIVALIKHPRLFIMLKAAIISAEKLNKKPESESAMRFAQMACDFFLEYRLTKKI